MEIGVTGNLGNVPRHVGAELMLESESVTARLHLVVVKLAQEKMKRFCLVMKNRVQVKPFLCFYTIFTLISVLFLLKITTV